MNKTELIAKLKAQRDELSLLVIELEAADSEVLASTPVASLNPQQFSALCCAAVSQAMKPVVVQTVEAANKIVENARFEDEAERLTATGVRRSRGPGQLAGEDRGN